MVISDPELYRKMIGLWQCTKIPGLQARLSGDQVHFTWQGEHKGFVTVTLSSAMFLQLEPVEIRDILEHSITERHGFDAKKYRNDFRGFTSNPLK